MQLAPEPRQCWCSTRFCCTVRTQTCAAHDCSTSGNIFSTELLADQYQWKDSTKPKVCLHLHLSLCKRDKFNYWQNNYYSIIKGIVFPKIFCHMAFIFCRTQNEILDWTLGTDSLSHHSLSLHPFSNFHTMKVNSDWQIVPNNSLCSTEENNSYG